MERPKIWDLDYFEENAMARSSYSKQWFSYNNYMLLSGFGAKEAQMSVKQRLGGVGLAIDKVLRSAGLK